MSATPDQLKLAKFLTETIGANPRIFRPVGAGVGEANAAEREIDILRLDDPVVPIRKFYSTVGLSDHPLQFQGREVSFRLELCMAGLELFEFVPEVLATAAMRIRDLGWECQPGAVFKDLITLHSKEEGYEMKHVYFTRPYLWAEKLGRFQLEAKTVTWLLAVPISDEELTFKIQRGDRALEAGFAEKAIDVSNLARGSALTGDLFH